ncbi:alanine- and arginine-rich domain-containing protein [Alosa pseudoharengus]|uniref:alanine- and arginine-rich domain-containing protein n=1 Tax=Alosa pseudoharengus TaxID=34774 RepID=UPI003F892E6F
MHTATCIFIYSDQVTTAAVTGEKRDSARMNPDTQCEDMLSTMVLENIKNKLLHAFRATGEARTVPDCSGASSTCVGRSFQANEELRRAKIDGAISWIRSELLEMRSQDRQLAQTLLGLNSEIQRLRRESSAAAATAPDPEGSQNQSH